MDIIHYYRSTGIMFKNILGLGEAQTYIVGS